MSLSLSKPLFSLTRNSYDEVLISGMAAAVDESGRAIELSLDIPEQQFPMRSLIKPMQATVAFSHLANEDRNLIALSSHSGELCHIKNISEWMASNFDSSELHCPEAFPLDPIESDRIKHSPSPEASRIYHPCSGKHLAYLKAAKKMGSNLNYWDRDHPLQVELRSNVDHTLDRGVEWITDSCGMPTCVTSLSEICLLWNQWRDANLSRNTSVLNAWQQSPALVGGSRRFDSWICSTSGGQLLAKEGADGLLVVTECSGPKRTVALKLASGYDPRFLAAGLMRIFLEIPSISGSPIDSIIGPLKARLTDCLPKDQQLNLEEF